MTGAFWGADAGELEALAQRVRAAASELEGIAGSLSSTLVATTWQGPDAELFQSDWHGVHARAVSNAVEILRQAATKLDFEAKQQLQASGDGASAGLSSVAGMSFGQIWSEVKDIPGELGHVTSIYTILDDGVGAASFVSHNPAVTAVARNIDVLSTGFSVAGGVFGAIDLATNSGPALVHDVMTRGFVNGQTVDEGLKSGADMLAIAAGVTAVLPPPADVASIGLGLAAASVDLTTWLDPQIGNQIVGGVHAVGAVTSDAMHDVGAAARDVGSDVHNLVSWL